MFKHIKDSLIKYLAKDFLPEEVFDASEYFRHFGGIDFDVKQEDGLYIAQSKNFQWGSIVTSGHNLKELDKNIKDAILTAFGVSSVYSKILKIENADQITEQVKEVETRQKYVLA